MHTTWHSGTQFSGELGNVRFTVGLNDQGSVPTKMTLWSPAGPQQQPNIFTFFPMVLLRVGLCKMTKLSSSFLLPKDEQPLLPLLPFSLLSHYYPLHYFSTHLQIHNKIILPSISVESFFVLLTILVLYWVTNSNGILNSYKIHSKVAVPLSHSQVEQWKQDIPVPHDTQ